MGSAFCPLRNRPVSVPPIVDRRVISCRAPRTNELSICCKSLNGAQSVHVDSLTLGMGTPSALIDETESSRKVGLTLRADLAGSSSNHVAVVEVRRRGIYTDAYWLRVAYLLSAAIIEPRSLTLPMPPGFPSPPSTRPSVRGLRLF